MEFYSKRSSYTRRIGAGITHQGGSTPTSMRNRTAIMTYVVASVFSFGVITFVTVCTEVDATQERSHAGNHIVVVVILRTILQRESQNS
jgi:hypothetical protein